MKLTNNLRNNVLSLKRFRICISNKHTQEEEYNEKTYFFRRCSNSFHNGFHPSCLFL